MKETYYFSHDSNARNDEKILCLRADYGITGYGIFWVLIEMMFENQDTSLSHKHVKGIAHSLNVDLDLLTDIINSCIEYGLFISDGEYFWSESLRTRKETFINKREKKVEAGLKSAEARKQNVPTQVEQSSNTVLTESQHNTNSVPTQVEQCSNSVPTQVEQCSNSVPTQVEQCSNSVPTQVEQCSNSVPTQVEQCSNSVPTQVEQCSNSVPTKFNKVKESKVKEIKEKEIFTSSSPPKSEISEEGREYANFFKGLLPPTQKVTESDLKNWADTFDKLVRIDKRPRDEIYQVTEWARKDSFWGEQGNFLSACKLRNKNKDGVQFYDIFLQKFKRERNNHNGTTNGKRYDLPSWFTGKT